MDGNENDPSRQFISELHRRSEAAAREQVLADLPLGWTTPTETLKHAGSVLMIEVNGTKFCARYGLDDQCRPLPAMGQVLEVLASWDEWQIGFWFDAVNSYLGGRRPRDVLASRPDAVVAAAKAERDWISNG